MRVVLIEESDRRHELLAMSRSSAESLLTAMGMVPDVVLGQWYLPFGQRNPGRIEFARIEAQ